MSDSGEFARERAALIRTLEEKGIHDKRVLAAMERVPRHAFCLPGDRANAYKDQVLPLPGEATLSQPFVVVLADLCGRQHVALCLDGPRSHEGMPVVLACRQGEG